MRFAKTRWWWWWWWEEEMGYVEEESDEEKSELVKTGKCGLVPLDQ